MSVDLVEFQRKLFKEMEALQTSGNEELWFRFSSGGAHFLLPALAVEVVGAGVKVVPIPGASSETEGIAQMGGLSYSVFDFARLWSQGTTATTWDRSSKVLGLSAKLLSGVALLVNRTFSLVVQNQLVPAEDAPPVPWISQGYQYEGQTWWAIRPDALAKESVFQGD